METINVRDFDIPEFKRKKCGLWGMIRYFGIIRTVRYVYWCIREHKLKIKSGWRGLSDMYAEDIKSFLESRNLSITRFARLVGVKYDPVRFYGTGENGYLDERTRRKIEAGLIVLRENESLVSPLWNKRYNFDTSYPRYIQKKREHEIAVEAFESEFKKRLVELGLGEIDV